MSLENENPGNGLQIVPGSYGMNVPSSCTIVFIKGKNQFVFKDSCMLLTLGKYLNRVDEVMTEVDKITENIEHMPVAAFIFRDKESDMVNYSSDKRLTIKIKLSR